ncbi:hypothetical protein EVAR_94079_1 [Eumeta japonica]|uniref:Uncharacterized protein n=1 Tax=Eumeta variegata TaxID=151549 RepID=A0A4C1V6M7_EUMVA|nr:hypothetical protein EVAR_94079_1 [Eumeta japonica]
MRSTVIRYTVRARTLPHTSGREFAVGTSHSKQYRSYVIRRFRPEWTKQWSDPVTSRNGKRINVVQTRAVTRLPLPSPLHEREPAYCADGAACASTFGHLQG